MSSKHRITGAATRGVAVAAALATLSIIFTAAPASATFHLAHIHRIMTGLGASTDVQYVEIDMNASGQNLVSGTKLIAYHTDGSFDHVVLTVASDLSSAQKRPWIMASSAFATAAGITPDFTFDSSAGKGLPARDAMVCWGNPTDPTKPTSFGMVDCVSYGNFTGPGNSFTSAANPLNPFGHGLVNVANTGSSASDFACEDPAMPGNNALQIAEIAATSPCTGCGNGLVDGSESCDDGDVEFKAGDFCSADCAAVPCGIPTDPSGTLPTAGDALLALRSAVGSVECDLRVCDVDDSTTVTATDALLILESAVGQNIVFNCPV